MNNSIRTTLATVFNIAVSEDGRQYIQNRAGVVVDLGSEIDAALVKAINNTNFDDECKFALFPIASGREMYYMQIENEMLTQEQFLKARLADKLGADPRELVTQIMEMMRECAKTLVNPHMFRINMLRAGCVVIASLQWIDQWISGMTARVEEAQKEAAERPLHVPPPLPKVVTFTEEKVAVEQEIAALQKEERTVPPPEPIFGGILDIPERVHDEPPTPQTETSPTDDNGHH